MAPDIALDVLGCETRSLRVLDPMAGSGTTLAAARLKGHRAIGFDRDPLAVLIAETWIADSNSSYIHQKSVDVLNRAAIIAETLSTTNSFPPGADAETKEFISYWFDVENRRQLTALAMAIKRIRDKEVRKFLWCGFSRMIITKTSGVSLAMDVSHSRPHKAYDSAPKKPFDLFPKCIKHILNASLFPSHEKLCPEALVSKGDARLLPLGNNEIDLIITSPPYLNAIDYMRGHRLSLVWMGYSIASLRALRSTNVGCEVGAREALKSEIAHIPAAMCSGNDLSPRHLGMLNNYVNDMHLFLRECHRVLRPGSQAVFVIGDCNVRGTFVENSKALEWLGILAGFSLKSSKRRPLPENRRYMPPPQTKSVGGSMRKRMREEVILTMCK